MINKFKEIIEKHKLIKKNDTIIIGSSGGPDSQLLTYLLNEIKEEYNLKLIVAHLNHLHRQEADMDEDLVRETARNLNLDFRLKRASMDEYAKRNKLSSEDAGRRLRYDFFYEIAKEFEGSKIAIAHNKNDQTETMLIRMIRGTGIDGLVAMDYKSNNIIRPILNVKKKDIIEFLDNHNISYAYDKTNGENDYTRNYIRNEIIPKMESVNPRMVDNFFNLSLLLRDDLKIIEDNTYKHYNEIVKESSDTKIVFDKYGFESLEDYLKAKVLRKAIFNLEGQLKDFSKENIDQFLSLTKLDTGKKIIKDRISLKKNYTSYDLYLEETKNLDKTKDTIDLDKYLEFNGLIINARLTNDKLKKDKFTAYFDYDKLNFPLTIRYRKNGDRIKPYGMNHNKKLKDFFIDEKIDRDLRDRIPLILSDDEIIWIVGHRVSNDFSVDNNTKNILKIEVKNDKWY